MGVRIATALLLVLFSSAAYAMPGGKSCPNSMRAAHPQEDAQKMMDALAALPPSADELERGKMIFDLAGCKNCHSKKDSPADKPLLGGGEAIDTPFGKFYGPNISPDKENGIGKWSNQDFVKALREGVRPDGKYYYPVFPYRSYTKLKDEDIIALRKYMNTLPEVKTKGTDHDLNFPYNVAPRIAIYKWRAFNFNGNTGNPDEDIRTGTGAFRDHPKRSKEWNRGAYLVESAGHCAECHTPRSSSGGLVTSQWMAGSPSGPVGKVPNITNDKGHGTGDWTKEDWVNFLDSGTTPNFNDVTGEMGKIIKGTKNLPQEDKEAIAVYMMSIKPPSPPEPGPDIKFDPFNF